jgi:HD-GYP domain-containing protein (c-di-GMP phosphodiesterase class II)
LRLAVRDLEPSNILVTASSATTTSATTAAATPTGLAGNAIPLAARLVSICDVYDALRSRRRWKPALSHAASLQLMTEASGGQFDPALIPVFLGCADGFDRTYQEVPG